MGAQGHTTIDFGAFPGKSDASVAITGQAGILAASDVEAWLRVEASADHSADEHRIETLKIDAGSIVAGTGFTIYAVNTSQINEYPPNADLNPLFGKSGAGTRLYGVYNVSWVWN